VGNPKESMRDKVARLEAEAREGARSLEESSGTVMALQESMRKQEERPAAEAWARKGLAACVAAVTVSLRAVADGMEGRGRPGIPGSFVVALCDYLDMVAEED